MAVLSASFDGPTDGMFANGSGGRLMAFPSEHMARAGGAVILEAAG